MATANVTPEYLMHDLQCGTTITYLSTTSITIQSRNVSQRQAVSTQECILSIDRAWTRDSESPGDLEEPLLTTHMAWIAPIERSEQVIQLARGVFQTHKSCRILLRGCNAIMVTPIQMDSLKKALSFDRPPLCSGAISPPPGGLHLWYGKKKSRCIRFQAPRWSSVIDGSPGS